MNASDLLLRILGSHGVRQIYGIPGDAINDILESIRSQSEIAFIQVRHEEAGAFAASGQAKLTGTLGACMGTAGPGAIHLLNGLYDAKMDHAPVIAITGQVATGYIGSEYHQEVDTKRLFDDVSVFNEVVTSVDQLPDLFMAACRSAISENGVAHISLPTNLSSQKVKAFDEKRTRRFAHHGKAVPSSAECKEAAALLGAAERPLIFAGIGCRYARPELVALAERLQAPIIRTLRAKDVIDDDHPLCIGGVGLLGGRSGIRALSNCDVLLLVGCDFPYRDFYPEQAKYIQIDHVASRVGRRHPVDIGLIGDAAATLTQLAGYLQPVTERAFLKDSAIEKARWIAKQEPQLTSDRVPLSPTRLVHEISNRAPSDAIFLSDTGTCTAWTARHLSISERRRYTLSGGLASMAFALPAAIGAQFAYPDRTVIAIAGDGGFSMLMQEFVTAVRYNLPIIVIVLNNGKLGLITLEQEASGLPDYGTSFTNPDYAAFAQACGGLGFTVDRPQDIAPAIDQALAANKATVINVRVDPNALILPPEIKLRQAFNFSLAKLKELFD